MTRSLEEFRSARARERIRAATVLPYEKYQQMYEEARKGSFVVAGHLAAAFASCLVAGALMYAPPVLLAKRTPFFPWG